MNTATVNGLHTHKRKLMIVDDHPIVRRGLAELLAREPDIEVCIGADNVTDALGRGGNFSPGFGHCGYVFVR